MRTNYNFFAIIISNKIWLNKNTGVFFYTPVNLFSPIIRVFSFFLKFSETILQHFIVDYTRQKIINIVDYTRQRN